MAAYSTGSSWGFPEDLPGGWVHVDGDGTGDETPPDFHNLKPTQAGPEQASPSPDQQSAPADPPPRRHYPPRTCRICLEVVLPTFHPVDASPLPSALQPPPRVTYESPPGDGGRLLRPCKCKGTQKYVHSDCLTAWRLQDPLQKRNYWQCPTCSYKYHLQRLSYSRWISSTASQVGLTLAIFVVGMFILGFVADPIINLYLDPITTISTAGGPTGSLIFEDEPATWAEHFIKGLASLGLLGFAKFLLTLSPWHWFNMRGTGVYVGGSGGRAGATGRDRLNQISWVTIVIGIITVLYAVWKGVRAWSRRTLEKAGERVMDVPGADEDEDEDEDAGPTAADDTTGNDAR
ncbi:uncharacterized protein LTR77_000248 [Saxophila tyrrhenica]|uniref:RING-CH-type domain-containing protein n=1 Tax=Saxophila tyrrhenica TaxID=1690608 RepID=A0AAV9PMU6_9PEZI|nr:hypothetical protein LTR77_000248 [Saxophila tyrrhenica]